MNGSRFGVFKISGNHALLMEFVTDQETMVKPLLRAIIDRVRDSGCNRLRLHNLHQWRHWPLVHRAGFRPRESEIYIGANCEDRPEVRIEENWSLMPSDSDVT